MGADDGLDTLSGAYSAGPSDASEGGEEEGEGDGESGPAPSTTGSQPPGGGNPLCCETHPTAGCESPATESCVCTSLPSCCQAVWTQECVELAAACGDPFCADATGGGTGGEDTDGEETGAESTGEPVDPPDPPDPTGDPPFPSCPCNTHIPEMDNFCDNPPNTPGCPMTAPGGYCDPNGDSSYTDGNWEQGWEDWHAQCA